MPAIPDGDMAPPTSDGADILALYHQLRALISEADRNGLARTGLALTQAAATLLAEGYSREKRGDAPLG